jgi:uncharacterized membrane protein SirB2
LEYYLTVKHFHIVCACLSAGLFLLRLLLDVIGKPGWRNSRFRFFPHINDTLLLLLAFTLLAMGPWQPFVHQWLGYKILLLIGYILSGMVALKSKFNTATRFLASALAILQLACIFYLAHFKPVLFG